jgi:hypothetical protein
LIEIALRGTGRVEVAAYGLADAEHQVEKELRALWPAGKVEVLDISRAGGSGRIVEEFTVRFRIRGRQPVEGGPEAAVEAVRSVRARFTGTRFERITLERDP